MIDNIVKLKDFVPLFQSIIWVFFLFGLMLVFKNPIRSILEELIERVRSGSSIKVGLIEIGELKEKIDYHVGSPDTAENVGVDKESKGLNHIKPPDTTENIGADKEKYRVSIYQKNKGLFLTHIISPSQKGVQKYDIYIYLIRHKKGGFPDMKFSDIKSADFFFGSMWRNNIFTVYPKKGIIGISVSAYAPFLCTCTLKFNDGSEMILDRYIDFEIGRYFKC